MGRPRGLVVKCVRSAAGSPGSGPGGAPMHRFSGHGEAASHIQQLEGCATMTYNYLLGLWGNKGEGLATDVTSEPVFLSKKKRIDMDVSSGLICLTKNKVGKRSEYALHKENSQMVNKYERVLNFISHQQLKN